MQPRRAARLSPTDAAYLAGLVDGEGSISLTRLHRGQNRQLALSISSTERALLEWVLNAARVGKITTKRTASPHHAPGLTYSVANRQALDLLVQVVPQLKSYKAERAQLAIDHYVRLTPRNGKYSEALRVARDEFERRFAAISTRRRRPNAGNCVREIARPWPARDCPARERAYQPACIDFTYSATACN
ncbi:MAG TPA: LAGLIDADG family homing endonuclease [Steroidobacteraceae bacterium]|nr:LAGLIDADG family homing endonuclease [Steroidobacteraceae bacterium]